MVFSRFNHEAGADPGFPVGGGANRPGGGGGGGGRQHTKLPNFPKNCMNLRKFWAIGGEGCAPPAPPKSANVKSCIMTYPRLTAPKTLSKNGYITP